MKKLLLSVAVFFSFYVASFFTTTTVFADDYPDCTLEGFTTANTWNSVTDPKKLTFQVTAPIEKFKTDSYYISVYYSRDAKLSEYNSSWAYPQAIAGDATKKSLTFSIDDPEIITSKSGITQHYVYIVANGFPNYTLCRIGSYTAPTAESLKNDEVAKCGVKDGTTCKFSDGTTGDMIENNLALCGDLTKCCTNINYCDSLPSNSSGGGTSGGGDTGGGGGGYGGSDGTVAVGTESTINIFEGPSSQNFKDLNPLEMFSKDSSAKAAFSSPGGFVSRLLLFAFPLAGLILFAMLVWAGFEIIMGAAGSKSIDAGRQRATAAIIGFLLLFVSYWIMQIVEVIFGVKIL